MAVLNRSDVTIGRVGGNTKLIEVTPTLDTNAYASGDRMGSIMTLTDAVRELGSTALLVDVAVIDKDKQSAAGAFDIHFFDESPTVASADNAAIDVSDAEMADKWLGMVSVLGGDYTDFAANSSASVKNLALAVKAISTSKDVYALLVAKGAPTHSAAGLVLKFKFLQD